jgi:hypothetical protein
MMIEMMMMINNFIFNNLMNLIKDGIILSKNIFMIKKGRLE